MQRGIMLTNKMGTVGLISGFPKKIGKKEKIKQVPIIFMVGIVLFLFKCLRYNCEPTRVENR